MVVQNIVATFLMLEDEWEVDGFQSVEVVSSSQAGLAAAHRTQWQEGFSAEIVGGDHVVVHQCEADNRLGVPAQLPLYHAANSSNSNKFQS